MAIEIENANQWVPINSLRRYDSDKTLRVFLIGSGMVKPFKNDKNQWRWSLIFVDEEGTKIQGIVFNNLIEPLQKIFQQNKTYYIIDSVINGVNPDFPSVHKDFEIFFKDHTLVKECENKVSTVMLSNNFVSFEEASEFPQGTIFDTVGILVKAYGTIRQGKSIRKEIVIMNERYDRKKLTLWGDMAEYEGDMLQKIILETPVVALCDIKSTNYRGEFGMSTTLVTTIVINPVFEKAVALQKWHDNVKAQNKDITIMPSREIKEARSVRLWNVIHDSFDDINVTHCKFNAKIKAILDAQGPWYLSCKKCYKKVNILNDIGKCRRCGILETNDYEERYLLKLEVSDAVSKAKADAESDAKKENRVSDVVSDDESDVLFDSKKENSCVSLFEAAKYLIGCDVITYRESISKEKDDSKFYRKLLSNIGKEFTFLVKINERNAEERAARRFVAEELQEVGKIDAIVIEDEEEQKEITPKKTKKNGDNDSLSNKKIKIEKN